MKIKSEKLEEVRCTIGQTTKKPNTVTMAVSNDFIIEVVALFDILKAGKKPKAGLCGLKLIAEYVEDIEDSDKQMELIQGMHDGLREVTGIDIESGDTEYDESLDIIDGAVYSKTIEEDEFRQGEK